jgi:hypothetical protein
MLDCKLLVGRVMRCGVEDVLGTKSSERAAAAAAPPRWRSDVTVTLLTATHQAAGPTYRYRLSVSIFYDDEVDQPPTRWSPVACCGETK